MAPEGSSVEGSPSHGAPLATTEGPEDNMAPAEGLPGPLPQDARQGALSCSSSVLDLSQSGLRHLGELLRVPSLQQLHLQRNALCAIPKDFFQLLPNLTWLDLRYNRIKALPSGIGAHRHLRTLLLENNPIKALPAELGNVVTLKALNLRHCPLEFPPQLIVQKGLVAILSFLRICATEHSCPHEAVSRESSPEIAAQPKEPAGPTWDLPGDHTILLQGPGATIFPTVEKLELDLLNRPDSAPHVPSEAELRRFWKVRQEIVGCQGADVLAHQLLSLQLPPHVQAVLDSKTEGQAQPKTRVPENTQPRALCDVPRKAPALRSTLPGLVPPRRAEVGGRRREVSRAVALAELRERQVLLEQQRARDKKVLQEWRARARVLPRDRVSQLLSSQRSLVPSKIPPASDLVDYGRTLNPLGRLRQGKERAPQAAEGPSAFRGRDLEARIKQHTLQARKLQDEVLKLKLGSTLDKDHQLTSFLGSLSLPPAASQPQNVFFNMKYGESGNGYRY